MAIHVKQTDWKYTRSLSIKKNGEGKKVMAAWVKDDNEWKKVFSEGIVGTVISTINHMSGFETPDECWQECNGSTITDPDSPLHGQSTPSLNGTTDANKRFLCGGTSSGSTGGSVSHGHTLPQCCAATCASACCNTPRYMCSNNHIPPSFDVKFYIRIK